MKLYSMNSFKFNEIPYIYPVENKIEDKWTIETAGGNSSRPTFMYNPQFQLELPNSDLKLLIMLQAPKELFVQIMFIPSGKRICR